MNDQPNNPVPAPAPQSHSAEVTDVDLYYINEVVGTEYENLLLEQLLKPAHPLTAYIRKRGITDEDIKKWKLGYAPDDWQYMTSRLSKIEGALDVGLLNGVIGEKEIEGKAPHRYDFFHDRLMIPIHDETGNCVGFTGRLLGKQEQNKPKYLNTRATRIFRKDEILFGINRAIRSISRSKTLVLTEGNFDVISLHRYGIDNAVGKGGTALTESQIATIKRLAEVVLLIYDVDDNGAGQKALATDCERLLEAGLRVQIFHLPPPADGTKIDADSYLLDLAAQQSPRAEKPLKISFANFQKVAVEGLIWLAETWFEPENLAAQVQGEKRSIELLALVQDDVWLKKYANRLARLFECKASELIKNAQKIRRVQENDQSPEENDEEESTQNKTVDYRSGGSVWVYGNKNWVCVADNFQPFIKYKTETENQEVSWVLEIKRRKEDPLFIKVTNEEFCSANKLKVKLASCDLAFKITDTYISELHQYLFSVGYPKAVEVTRLGYHHDSGVYFFANKAMNGKLLDPDDHGIVSCQDRSGQLIHLAMPQPSKNLKKNRTFFRYNEGTMTFNQWYEHLVPVHKYENVIIPVCFYLMALYRDVLVKHTNTCPMLYLKGGTSSGKSSIVRSMCQLFGFKEPAANLKSRVNEAALIRKMSQLSNSLIWLEEMENDFEYKGALQASYDNTGYSRSTDATSIETDSVEIYSAIAITSNYVPDDEILFSRYVFIPIIEQQKTKQQAIDYKHLNELQENGLACVTVEILQHRQLIETEFPTAHKKMYDLLETAVQSEKVVVRLISNVAQVLTVGFILQAHGKICLMEFTDESDILEEFVRMGTITILRQHQIASEKSNLTEFFEIIQNQYEMGYVLEGIHFRFQGEQVLLRFPALYRIYSQRYRNAYYKAPADRDTLRQEMMSLEGITTTEELFKSIRFTPEPSEPNTKPTRPVNDSCALTYKKVQDRFGLDLEIHQNMPKTR